MLELNSALKAPRDVIARASNKIFGALAARSRYDIDFSAYKNDITFFYDKLDESRRSRRIDDPEFSDDIVLDFFPNFDHELLSFYLDVLDDTCVYTDIGKEDDKSPEERDIEIFLNVYKRLAAGVDIAEVKYEHISEIRESINDTNRLRELLTDSEKEREILLNVANRAIESNIEPYATTDLFKWLIAKTTKIEIDHLQRKYGDGN